MRRVAVTGLGVVSPFGTDLRKFWDGLRGGLSAAGLVQSFDASAFNTRLGVEIKGDGPREAFAYALGAARAALKDAGASGGGPRSGIALGTTSGEFRRAEDAMDRRLKGDAAGAARALARCGHGSIPARLAAALGFKGPNAILTTACAAGNYAISHAAEAIRGGRADLMLAGGVDVFSRITFAGFSRLFALAPERCAPFSLGRKGLVPSEGAAVLVLEDWEAARAAGRRIYAEVLGVGVSSDASHVTMPDPDGVARAIEVCLKETGLRPEEIDYISAHGTGTPANDKTESAAVKKTLGGGIPMSSIKSMIGHSMGAASAFEAVACCLAMRAGEMPPTIHFTPGDPECGLDYVPDRARKKDLKTVLSNAFAFGGSNSVLALSREGRPGLPAPRAARVAITGIGTMEPGNPVEAVEKLLPDADLSFIDGPIALALGASRLALSDAGLGGGADGGVILDTIGENESLFEFYKSLVEEGPRGVEPRRYPNILANAAASRVAIAFGLKRLNQSFGGCFPGGENAVAAAYDRLSREGEGFYLAGGVAEGAEVLVLEPLERARARGARVYAELAGYEESFEPREEPRAGAGCFCLAQALRGFKGDLEFVGRGVWGGAIRLKLAKD